jgi:hypothetical protein
MFGFQHHPNSFGFESCLEALGDLHRQSLLELEVARKELDDAGELGQADDPLGREVPDVSDPVEGRRWCMHRDWNGISRTTTSSSYPSSFGKLVKLNGSGVSMSQ